MILQKVNITDEIINQLKKDDFDFEDEKINIKETEIVVFDYKFYINDIRFSLFADDIVCAPAQLFYEHNNKEHFCSVDFDYKKLTKFIKNLFSDEIYEYENKCSVDHIDYDLIRKYD